MEIKIETVIQKPAAAVWEVLGNQFGTAYRWASIIHHSDGEGARLAGGVCEERACDVQGMGKLREKLLQFNPQELVLEYLVTEGMPFFVARGTNHWSLRPDGQNTHLSIRATIETKGILGVLMAPMMKMQMTGMMNKMAEELKHFVETGAVHPRKLKAIAKANRQASSVRA